MALRLSFLLLLLALALVAESSMSDAHLGLTYFSTGARGTGGLIVSQTCNGLIGECINQEEEMMMESEISRRSLGRGKRWISYDALKKNRVPCNRRGRSYYGCGRASKANPYKRNCNTITHCKRSNN